MNPRTHNDIASNVGAGPAIEICDKDIVLRPWDSQDAEALAAAADNRNIWTNLRERFPKPYTAENARTWIKRKQRQTSRSLQFAIVVAGVAVGGIGIDRDPNPRTHAGELGYWLDQNYWNRGIAGKAVQLVTTHAFGELGFLKLTAVVRQDNFASTKILERSGFHLSGKVRRGGRRPSAYVVELVYTKQA